MHAASSSRQNAACISSAIFVSTGLCFAVSPDACCVVIGSSLGLAVPMLAVPLAQVAAGTIGLQVATIWSVVGIIAGNNSAGRCTCYRGLKVLWQLCKLHEASSACPDQPATCKMAVGMGFKVQVPVTLESFSFGDQVRHQY